MLNATLIKREKNQDFYKKWHSKTPVITEKAVAMDNKVRGAELHPSASHSQYSILIL